MVIDDAQFLDKDSWTLALAVATGELATVYRQYSILFGVDAIWSIDGLHGNVIFLCSKIRILYVTRNFCTMLISDAWEC